MSKGSRECKASHPSHDLSRISGCYLRLGGGGRCCASGTGLCVKSAHVLTLVKETLQTNKKPAAELSALWGGWAGWLLPHCLVRLVLQKLVSSLDLYCRS